MVIAEIDAKSGESAMRDIRDAGGKAIFAPTDDDGNNLSREKLPLVIALTEKKPAHLRFQIKGLDNVLRQIEVTAFPLIGEAGRDLGAVAIFWDMKS